MILASMIRLAFRRFAPSFRKCFSDLFPSVNSAYWRPSDVWWERIRFLQWLSASTSSESFAGVSEQIHHERLDDRAFILDGRLCSTLWLQQLHPRVQDITKALSRAPKLSVILVGDRPDSHLYVQRKKEVCNQCEIDVTVCHLPHSISQETLESTIQMECDNPRNDGVLIQLPLPSHLDEESISAALDPWKDVDGVHPLNVGHMMMRGHSPRLIPCTALGCMKLLELNKILVKGKTAVVVGDSNIVGVPLSVLLRNENAAIVSVCHGISYRELFEDQEKIRKQRVEAEACHPTLPGPIDKWSLESRAGFDALCPISRNPHLPSITQNADILIVAVGWPNLVKKDWVKPGAVVLDVGINVIPKTNSKLRQQNYQIAGDVQFEEVVKIASAISPVPGGIGPMTLAAVVHNTIQAAEYTLRNGER